jgi:hypothetical protein
VEKGARILGAQDQAAFAPAALTGFRRVTAIALDALRHALPLVPFYLRRGNITAYLLLTAFDLSLGLMLIVGTTRERGDRTTVDPRATWLVSRLTAVLVLGTFLGLVAAIISLPMGIPAFIFGTARGVNWPALLSQPGFWMPAAVMALVAGARAQHNFETVTTPGKTGTSPYAAPVIGNLEQDRRRSKAAYAAQVTIIASYVALSYLLSVFGRSGLFVFPIVFATLLVFYDARPDIGQRIFPKLWRETK